MRRFIVPFTGLSAILLAVAIFGCSQPSDSNATNDVAPNSGDHTSGSDHGSMADMEKGLAELTEAERATAMKQHVCPVSGEMLGTMGKPINVSINDNDVWVCCGGCTEQLKQDPDKYLAKLEGHEDHSDHQSGK